MSVAQLKRRPTTHHGAVASWNTVLLISKAALADVDGATAA